MAGRFRNDVVFVFVFDCSTMLHVADADYVRFIKFMLQHASDESYEENFRARFDSEGERTDDQVQTVHSIWRVNNSNRQLVDMIEARLTQVCADAPVSRLLRGIRDRGIRTIEIVKTPAVCDLTNQTVDFGRKIVLRAAKQVQDRGEAIHPPGQTEWTVRSDLLQILRYYNVLANFVECTVARFKFSEQDDDAAFENHYRDWQCCRNWLKAVAQAISALPK